jgi:hypothetical protein
MTKAMIFLSSSPLAQVLLSPLFQFLVRPQVVTRLQALSERRHKVQPQTLEAPRGVVEAIIAR